MRPAQTNGNFEAIRKSAVVPISPIWSSAGMPPVVLSLQHRHSLKAANDGA
jgi:hypothetical protein